MFNNWLKRRDDNSENEETTSAEELETSTSAKKANESHEDDYYYYYYYESDRSDNEPTIPNLASTVAADEEKLEYYDSAEGTYTSPFESNDISDAVEQTADFSYEKDYVDVGNEINSVSDSKVTLLEDENNQLRAKIDELLLENQNLTDQTERLSFVEENNQRLSEQIDEYTNLLEENNELKIKLLDADKVAETSVEHESQLKELADKVSELTETAEKQQAENADLIATINSLESEKDELTISNAQLRDEFKMSVSTFDTEKAELDTTAAQFKEEIEKVVATLESEKEALSQENANLQVEAEKNASLIETLKSENEVFVGRIEELQNASTDNTETALVLEENKRIIIELEEELKQSKELETELINRYEAEIANNKNFITKNEQELAEMNEKLSQTEGLELELAELKANQQAILDLQQELSNMRQQQADVTASLTELASEKTRAARLEQEVSDLKSVQSPDTVSLQAELIRVKEELRLANLAAEQNTSMNQADIAHVMLEAQAKARQIVDVANYEAKRRVADSEMELSAVSQEARNYYRKLEKLKADSEVVFSELLRKLESIGDIDRL